MLKEYTKRVFITALGMLIYAFGSMLGVKAGDVGTNAWATLSLGLTNTFGISFGTGNFLVSLLIIIIAVLAKGRLGFGTVLNVLLYPVFADMFLAIFDFVPMAPNQIIGLVCTMLCQVIVSFATVLYMLPALGCGPRDTMMIVIGRKFPKAPIGLVRFFIEAAAMICGVLLGAPFGIGTVLVMVLQASIFQLVCRICRYEPRAIVHENFADTFRRIRQAEGAKN